MVRKGLRVGSVVLLREVRRRRLVRVEWMVRDEVRDLDEMREGDWVLKLEIELIRLRGNGKVGGEGVC